MLYFFEGDRGRFSVSFSKVNNIKGYRKETQNRPLSPAREEISYENRDIPQGLLSGYEHPGNGDSH